MFVHLSKDSSADNQSMHIETSFKILLGHLKSDNENCMTIFNQTGKLETLN
jgi:hypothetical protein